MTERSIECGHCKKPIKVIYKEIVGDQMTITEMCAYCPLLQQKMGILPNEEPSGKTSLQCGRCHTSLDAIQKGDFVGCAECYTVFKEPLITELIARDEISPRLLKTIERKKNLPLHMGKSPEKPSSFILSSQLSSLNEALNESLKQENYEKAAWLRDQIQSLKKNP
jgi:protein arginine kinase activator